MRLHRLVPALFGLAFLAACQQPPNKSSDTATADTSKAKASDVPSATANATATNAPSAPATSAPGDLPAPPDVAAPPADAQKTASGLASKVIKPGTGKEHPTADDTVKVHYTGWTKAGQMFDSSEVRKEPVSFPLNAVIKGWTEGVQLMVVGERRRLWIPSALAYGDKPRMPGAPAGDPVFDVARLGIKAAPKAPEDVKAPPANAKKTPSGLAFRVLKPGTGKSPKETDTVEVHYTGWTTDGKMFDSSVMRGE